MKQVSFKELELGSKTIVAVDSSAINRIIFTTKTVDNYINYYWLDADVTNYGILIPVLYELTEEEVEKYLGASTTS